MMLVAWPVVDAAATLRTGPYSVRRVVLGDDDHRGGQRQADQRGEVQVHRAASPIERRA